MIINYRAYALFPLWLSFGNGIWTWFTCSFSICHASLFQVILHMVCECVHMNVCVYAHVCDTYIYACMCIFFLFWLESLPAIFGFHVGDHGLIWTLVRYMQNILLATKDRLLGHLSATCWKRPSIIPMCHTIQRI